MSTETETGCRPSEPYVEKNSFWKEEFKCQWLSKSAPRFSELERWQARSSNSCTAARNQISRKKTANNLSRTRPEFRELTTEKLSQWTIIRRPRQRWPHSRRAITIGKASRRWIAVNRRRTCGGNSTWKYCSDDIPPQPVKHTSGEKILSGADHDCVGIRETPL